MHQRSWDVERFAVRENAGLDGMIARPTDTTFHLELCTWHCTLTSCLDRLVVEETSSGETGRTWTGQVRLHNPEDLVPRVSWPKALVVDVPMASTVTSREWDAGWV